MHRRISRAAVVLLAIMVPWVAAHAGGRVGGGFGGSVAHIGGSFGGAHISSGGFGGRSWFGGTGVRSFSGAQIGSPRFAMPSFSARNFPGAGFGIRSFRAQHFGSANFGIRSFSAPLISGPGIVTRPFPRVRIGHSLAGPQIGIFPGGSLRRLGGPLSGPPGLRTEPALRRWPVPIWP
jgi:hypothetical protein